MPVTNEGNNDESKTHKFVDALLLALNAPAMLAAQESISRIPGDVTRTAQPTIELSQLLESGSRKSGKMFLVDNRVPAEVVVGQLIWRDMTYPLLLSVLRNNGLAAATVEGTVSIVPVASIRQYALPVVKKDDDTIADDEWVMRTIISERISAPMLVPIVRPLMPSAGLVAGIPESNALIVIARYANVRRITQLVHDMDQRAPEAAGQ